MRMSSAYCSEISYIIYFHIIKNTLFDYLFHLEFIVCSFRYQFSWKYYPQVFSLVFIASDSKYFIFFINEAVTWSQIFHSFQRDKYPPLRVSPPSSKIVLANTPSPPPPQFSYCFYGILVIRNLFCFNKLA